MRYLRILLLEDDPLQSEQIAHDLKTRLAPIQVEVEHIATEYDFRQRIDRIGAGGGGPASALLPDVAILDVLVIADVMLPWTTPDPNSPKTPPDVMKEGFLTAGLRCRDWLLGKAPHIPIIL